MGRKFPCPIFYIGQQWNLSVLWCPEQLEHFEISDHLAKFKEKIVVQHLYMSRNK